MATPTTATSLGESLETQAIKDYRISCATALEPGEEIDPAHWDLTPTAEALALGLIHDADATYPDPTLNTEGYAVDFWLRIDQAFAGNAAFTGAGTPLPLVLTFQTTSTPPRKDQATFYVTVVEK
ncbi:MAG: hypothetical protein IPO08_19820 [Xanthomonadales bacterium]|nr:hypothetical protein [Xanthomonadales bacterium]